MDAEKSEPSRLQHGSREARRSRSECETPTRMDSSVSRQAFRGHDGIVSPTDGSEEMRLREEYEASKQRRRSNLQPKVGAQLKQDSNDSDDGPIKRHGRKPLTQPDIAMTQPDIAMTQPSGDSESQPEGSFSDDGKGAHEGSGATHHGVAKLRRVQKLNNRFMSCVDDDKNVTSQSLEALQVLQSSFMHYREFICDGIKENMLDEFIRMESFLVKNNLVKPCTDENLQNCILDMHRACTNENVAEFIKLYHEVLSGLFVRFCCEVNPADGCHVRKRQDALKSPPQKKQATASSGVVGNFSAFAATFDTPESIKREFFVCCVV